MNAEVLLALYERVADAPGAIPRLRRFVLDLAVRGKLVERPSEECGSLQLDLDDSASPFEVPPSWRWMRIGDQLDLLNGVPFKPSDWRESGVKIVRIQNLNNPLAPFNHCDPKAARERSLIDDGSFLISWSGTPGTSFGAFIWKRGPAVLNQHIFRCDFKTDLFAPEFLRLAVNGRLDEMIAKAHGGVGLQHITKGKLEALLVPLPPLSVQNRIVAKVDELMALLDRLEAARSAREATRDRLTTASLTRLTAPETDSEAHRTHGRFVLEYLPALSTRADQVKQLRQTILGLAVLGRLLGQQEPICDGSATRTRTPAGSLSAPTMFDVSQERLPEHWVWTTIDHVSDLITDGEHSTPPRITEAQVPLVTAKNVRDGFFDFAQTDWVSMETAEKAWRRCRPQPGDLLMVCVGATTGRLAVLSTPCDMVLVRSVALIRPNSAITSRFLELAIRSPVVQTQIWASVKVTAQPCLYLKKIKEIRIALPPVDEQLRIVDKVEELMTLCDRLEAALQSAETTRARLLEALLHEALASGTTEREAA
jgi:type I restriction enzyme S subunit